MRSFKPPVVVRPTPVRLAYAAKPTKMRARRKPPFDPIALSALVFAALVFPAAGLAWWKWLSDGVVDLPVILLIPGAAAAAIVLGSWARWRPMPAFRPLPGVSRAALRLGLVQILLLAGIVSGRCLYRSRAPVDRCAECQANLQILGKAILQYVKQNNQELPPDLPTAVLAAGFGEDQLVCPASTNHLTIAPASPTRRALLESILKSGRCSYVMAPLAGDATILTKSHVLAYEPKTRHDGGMNVLFADGHVETVPKGQAEDMLAEFRLGHNPPW